MTIEQNLRWLILSGVTETIGNKPMDRLNRPKTSPQAPQAKKSPAAPITAGESALTDQSKILAASANTLADLYARRANFDGCTLKKTAAHTLNGFGAENPDVLCILELPDTDDERAGKLAGGPAGELLRRMLAAINLDLDRNAYVTTLIPWRTPGNRPPTEAELAICRPFWEREVDLLHPRLILAFGGRVSQTLLGISALSRARGTWHEYRGIPTRVTIPPATLLRLPAQKKAAWEDLQQLATRNNELPSS